MVWEHVEGAQWRCVSHPHVSFKVLNVNVRSVFEQLGRRISFARPSFVPPEALANALCDERFGRWDIARIPQLIHRNASSGRKQRLRKCSSCHKSRNCETCIEFL